MKVLLYSREGKKKQEVVLNPDIYGVRANDRLLELVRNAYAGNLRKGTADTKTRGEVRGGGKKPWKQKGTGRARHGSTRSPIWVGGGTVFGPHPRDYSVSLSKTIRNQALKVMLSKRAGEKNLMLLEALKLETPKTKEFAAIVKALPIPEKRALYVVKETTPNLKRASRNMRERVEVKTAAEFSAYDVMQREKIVIDEAAVELIEKRLAVKAKEKSSEA
ncbi:MAG TPA: 50S ribosomal protein L4 [Candidatus Omnitrophota bacterium]|nr:50S ribosomal protein L4 [Candidatus Omnitrophota bacterium]HRY86103.1 50S ribosomal protein L4 [Candidatus Omnitrophota bacterium]